MASEDFAPRRVDIALRALDLLIAGSALIVLSPLLGLLALGILLTSGTPVLYRGERVGRAGRVFTMFKLRTLKGELRGDWATSTGRSSAGAPSRR